MRKNVGKEVVARWNNIFLMGTLLMGLDNDHILEAIRSAASYACEDPQETAYIHVPRSPLLHHQRLAE